MKKRLLLLVALAAGTVYGQGEQPQEGALISPELLNTLNHQSAERRTVGAMDRDDINGWVSFELTEYEFAYGEDAFFTYGQVISPDTLPRVSFTGGVFRSYTHGFGQLFDPTAEDMDFSDSRLAAVDSYSIDSIGFPSIYRRVNHNDIDDTLIITVAVTDKETSGGNPYDGSFWWTPTGLLPNDMYVVSPSYTGDAADGYHHGLTGVTEPGNNVEIQQYKFALTEDDTEIFWRSFPVEVDADPDQVVYTFVEFKPSFEATITDTAFVFDGAEGEANTNSFRTVYDYPVTENVGYFFDLYREDEYSYNASYVAEASLRYSEYSGDDEWRNSRLNVYSLWGFRFEYFMNAVSSLSVDEETVNNAFSVYPNPSTQNGQIIITGKTELTGLVSIQDIDGRELYSENVNGVKELKLDSKNLGLAAGVYIMSLTNNGNKITKKLIIE